MNKRIFKSTQWVAAVLITAAIHSLSGGAATGAPKHTFTTPKGLNVTTLNDPAMDFVHAELLIFHKGKFNNPVIPTLTLLNLFDRNINRSGSDLLDILERLGNDFQVEQTADYLALKVNFLPDKFQQFARFLKALYSYNPFLNIKINPDSYTFRKREHDTSQKFEAGIANYWRYFFRRENWKREIAYQIAYSKLFPGSSLGNTLITAETLNQAALTDVRAFYQRAFRLPNSLLILKGNIDSQVARAYLNSEFSFFKEQVPEVPVEEKLIVADKREIIVFNISSVDSPVMYWFEAIEPLDNDRHIPLLVLNNILFGFPVGRIYLSAREMDMGNLDIRSEVTNQREVSVICNTIELRYRDIETFIQLADRERKKITIKKVERNEYLNTLSYFYGKIKVDTQYFENEINHEIMTSFYSFKTEHFMKPDSRAQVAQFTLAGLNERIEETKGFIDSPRGVIVIIGNYELMGRYLKTLKPVVYNEKR